MTNHQVRVQEVSIFLQIAVYTCIRAFFLLLIEHTSAHPFTCISIIVFAFIVCFLITVQSGSGGGGGSSTDFSKKEEFRRYLEKTGVMDALTKVLVGLYEGTQTRTVPIVLIIVRVGVVLPFFVFVFLRNKHSLFCC